MNSSGQKSEDQNETLDRAYLTWAHQADGFVIRDLVRISSEELEFKPAYNPECKAID
jgi:hypothetical protein